MGNEQFQAPAATVIYAIKDNGDLLWYRHDGRADGSFTWAFGEGKKVGIGWHARQVFSGGDGAVYAIMDNGDLFWNRHDGRGDGSFTWAASEGQKVGNGWNGFSTVFSGGDGVIYAIEEASRDVRTGQRTGGHLLWYRHDGWRDGSASWADGPRTVGKGWGGLAKVFAGTDGVIYAIRDNGDLLWYRHDGQADGSFTWAAESGKQIGNGWGSFSTVFSGGEGVIYALEEVSRDVVTGQRTGGRLLWYRHDGWRNGSPAWAEGPRVVGKGWSNLSAVFAGIGDALTTVGAVAGHCGVPDRSPGGLHVSAYGSPGSRWSRGNLTYNVSANGSGLNQAAVNAVMAAAFQQWQTAAPYFSFRQVAGNADIQVRFGGTTLDASFGSPGGVLAVGAYPEDGRLSFDASENWAAGTVLLQVALHEIGHVLGLRHSTSRQSVMYPYDLSRTTLDPETVQAIQGLYGWQPQIRLTDRASVEGPALASVGGGALSFRSYMAWRGIADDSALYWSSFDGNGWSPQEIMPGIGSSHGPALAAGFTRNRADGVPVTGLFMAWDGAPGDSGIYFAESPDPTFSGWTSQQRVSGVGTSDRPALALFNGNMCMAWKGVAGDAGIYWSQFNGNAWSSQQLIRGRGTTHGPALAVSGNRLYMFWKGIEGDAKVYYSWIDDQPGAIWQAQRVVAYTDARAEGNVTVNIGTSSRPAAAVQGSAIVLAWKGISDDSGLYFAFLQNDEWSGQVRVAGVGSASGPALTRLNGRLTMAWRGIRGDSGLYYSWLG